MSQANPIVELRQDELNVPAISGDSLAMQILREQIRKAAGTDAPVLIVGEPGAGKDAVARAIHGLSRSRTGPFIAVRCATMGGTWIEGELFGPRRAPMVGKVRTAAPIEISQRGTLFFDGISELSFSQQDAFLAILETSPLWGIQMPDGTKIKFRVLCAADRRLDIDVEQGKVRQDLRQQIGRMTLTVPPLRERLSDVRMLVGRIIDICNRKYACQAGPLSPEMMLFLESYRWPGNVSELEGLIEQYVIHGNERVITRAIKVRRAEELLNPEVKLDGAISLKDLTRQATRDLERTVILKVLEAHRWNRKRAARALSISYRSLLYKIQETGLVKGSPASQLTVVAKENI